MINIKIFEFNPFQVNTYILYDETKECVIIDAACFDDTEKEELAGFIKKENLTPVRLLTTHFHIDHILGNSFIYEKYGLKPEIHKTGEIFVNTVKEYGLTFGLHIDKVIKPEKFIEEGDIIKFGKSELTAVYTPGHAEGSLCFVSKEPEFVITGDVLFHGSVGRSDLPTGNHKLLLENIKNKLFTLGDEYLVYPGHGPKTRIWFEKKHNPFLKQ